MESMVNRVSVLRLVAALISTTVAAWLLAFTAHVGTASVLFVVPWLLTVDRKDLSAPMAVSKGSYITLVSAVLFVAFLLLSAASGATKTSNEWFVHWPYRPYFVCVTWATFVIALLIGFCKRRKANAT